jgi:hypothetical protein
MSRINFGKLIAEDSEKWKGDLEGQHQAGLRAIVTAPIFIVSVGANLVLANATNIKGDGRGTATPV